MRPTQYVSKSGFRLLDEEDLEVVHGGTIVVTGDRDDDEDDGDITDYGDADYDDYDNPDDEEDQGDGDDPLTPEQQFDSDIDSLAQQVLNTINQMPDSATKEYGAIIWVDANGNLHVTDVTPGTSLQWDPSSVWSQVDFANGGQVVGMVHSHPTYHQYTDHNGNPAQRPQQDGKYPSSVDFDRLIDIGNGNSDTDGYSNDDYRIYIVHQGNIHEYHAEDQNQAFYGVGGMANWAVERVEDYENDWDE